MIYLMPPTPKLEQQPTYKKWWSVHPSSFSTFILLSHLMLSGPNIIITKHIVLKNKVWPDKLETRMMTSITVCWCSERERERERHANEPQWWFVYPDFSSMKRSRICRHIYRFIILSSHFGHKHSSVWKKQSIMDLSIAVFIVCKLQCCSLLTFEDLNNILVWHKCKTSPSMKA